MNKVFILVLAIISLECVAAGEAREVLRARLSVRRNNLKAADAKATEALNVKENFDNAEKSDAGALLESQVRLSALTKRFKQHAQLPQQTALPEAAVVKAVEAKSEDSLAQSKPSSLIQTAVESTESSESYAEEDVLQQLIDQAIEQLRAVKAQAERVKRESQLKYMVELVNRIEDFEALVTGRKSSMLLPYIAKQIHEQNSKNVSEIQNILDFLRPYLEKAQLQAKIHEKVVKRELITTYRYIKKVIDGVREEIVEELTREIAINYPFLAYTLGLFNELVNNNVSSTSDNSTTFVNTTSTSQEDVPSAAPTDVVPVVSTTPTNAAPVVPTNAAPVSPAVPTSSPASPTVEPREPRKVHSPAPKKDKDQEKKGDKKDVPAPSKKDKEPEKKGKPLKGDSSAASTGAAAPVPAPKKDKDQEKKGKSLKGDEPAKTDSPVKSEALAANGNKLKRQLSKSR